MTHTRTFPRKTASVVILAALLGAVIMMLALARAQDTTKQDTTQADQQVKELMVAKSDALGEYLTDSNGRALYLFLADSAKGSNCAGDCAVTWPPVLVSDANTLPTLAPAMDQALLKTIKRDDGTLQLTYNGWPLYYFSGDSAAGDTKGQGLNNKWYLVTTDGMGASITAGEPGGGPAPETAP